MKLLLLPVGGDCTTNNVRSVVSISGGLGRPFNHGLRGAEPLYHHWTVSRANCGYISLSPWPAHRNDPLAGCRATHSSIHTKYRWGWEHMFICTNRTCVSMEPRWSNVTKALWLKQNKQSFSNAKVLCVYSEHKYLSTCRTFPSKSRYSNNGLFK